MTQTQTQTPTTNPSPSPGPMPKQVKRISRYAHLLLEVRPGQADRPPTLLARTVRAQGKDPGPHCSPKPRP